MKKAERQRPIQECWYTVMAKSMTAVISFLIIIIQGKAKMQSDPLENLMVSLYVTVMQHTMHSKIPGDVVALHMSEDTG